mgnify:CR=1 FL=1
MIANFKSVKRQSENSLIKRNPLKRHFFRLRMPRWYGQLLFWLMIGTVGLLCLGTHANAQRTNPLPPGLVIADQEGLQIDDDGRYWIDLLDVLPGARYQKEITIRNADLADGFALRLVVRDGEKEGGFDFYQAVHLELFLEEQLIYSGGILGRDDFDWTQEPLELGSYYSGDSKVLTARFQIDTYLERKAFETESEQLFYWQFLADRLPSEEVPKKADGNGKQGFLGHLGDSLEKWLYQIIALLLLLIVGLVKYYQHRQKSHETRTADH